MKDTTHLKQLLADRLLSVSESLGEVTIEISPEQMLDSFRILRDAPELRFEQLIDLCGVDYSVYGSEPWEKARFAAVYHLLSVSNNQRVRVKVFASDDAFPVLDSVVEIWSAANWFEREAFDLFGIVFSGHPDLRRILTDYGFVGNPFRKDFPLSGNVEMRYDPVIGRVVYEPVSIAPREITPRIIRAENYGEV